MPNYLEYEKSFPEIKLSHLMTLTDDFGVIQFANHTNPDTDSGYSLDDNARAIIVCCMHSVISGNNSEINLLKTYINFIKHIQQPDGKLYNFVDYDRKVNLEQWSEDAHGRAIWSLGFLIFTEEAPKELKTEAELIFCKALKAIKNIKSPRAVAFIIAGLYFYNKIRPLPENISRIRELTNHLISLYNSNSSDEWHWFESYLTYSNSKLPESLLYSYLATQDKKYLEIAESSLDFLVSVTLKKGMFSPVGSNGWYLKNNTKSCFAQQPVDTASMVQTLVLAYDVTKKEEYLKNAINTFQWFLGKNILNQAVYDESNGGCHDGIDETSINLNQGAESTISYLMARLSLNLFLRKSKSSPMFS